MTFEFPAQFDWAHYGENMPPVKLNWYEGNKDGSWCSRRKS